MRLPYKLIKGMVTKYLSQMKAIDTELQKNPSGPQLNTKSPIGVYFSKEELDEAKATIEKMDGFSKYIAIFGVEDETKTFTVCLVGADADGNILPAYKKDDSIVAAWERWPGARVTLASGEKELNDFLNG